ncbi:MAG: acyltransferase, partial [Chloroflexi bacterium]|nr:acyltransferase [Chloroflexota bacterium]
MTIYEMARIVGQDRITIGSHVVIDDLVFIGRHEELVIGNYVHVASHVSITGGGTCFICDFAQISSGVRILSGTDDFSGGGLAGPAVPQELRNVRRGRVAIGAHAIIGANAVVLPDTEVGEGATVGAGSVVVESLEPWGIYAGAPARLIRPRPRERILALE